MSNKRPEDKNVDERIVYSSYDVDRLFARGDCDYKPSTNHNDASSLGLQ